MERKEDFLAFTTKVRDAGQGTMEITLPKPICELLDISQGDFVEMLVKKAYKKE